MRLRVYVYTCIRAEEACFFAQLVRIRVRIRVLILLRGDVTIPILVIKKKIDGACVGRALCVLRLCVHRCYRATADIDVIGTPDARTPDARPFITS